MKIIVNKMSGHASLGRGGRRHAGSSPALRDRHAGMGKGEPGDQARIGVVRLGRGRGRGVPGFKQGAQNLLGTPQAGQVTLAGHRVEPRVGEQ